MTHPKQQIGENSWHKRSWLSLSWKRMRTSHKQNKKNWAYTEVKWCIKDLRRKQKWVIIQIDPSMANLNYWKFVEEESCFTKCCISLLASPQESWQPCRPEAVLRAILCTDTHSPCWRCYCTPPAHAIRILPMRSSRTCCMSSSNTWWGFRWSQPQP